MEPRRFRSSRTRLPSLSTSVPRWLIRCSTRLLVTDKSAQEAWDAEVGRRIEGLQAGREVNVPWEDLHRELLAMMNV